MITFIQPIILSALIALPLIWYFLRISPPAPKTIIFPPTHFLKNLLTEESFPSKTPWWILLLRLMIAALIILALANPVINKVDKLPSYGSIRILIDNSWAAAQNWDNQIKEAKEIISQADREGRYIYILTTTPAIGKEHIKQYGPLLKSDAIATLLGLTPNSWSANYDELIKTLKTNNKSEPIYTIWLSHGIDEGNIKKVLEILQSQGGIKYISPKSDKMPLLLQPTKKNISNKTTIDIKAPTNIETTIVSIEAISNKNDIVDIQNVKLDNKNNLKTIEFDIMGDIIKSNITKFKISQRSGAGAIFILDDQNKKRKVGIVSTAQKEIITPLMNPSYYIKRALEPFANILTGSVNDLIKENVEIIIMNDIATIPHTTLNNLEKWVNHGGLLLRFAGENMAKSQNEQFLVPVILKSGGRSLSGTLSWNKQQKIAPFPENSPLYGLNTSDEITIKQYLLADPSQGMKNKIWASLDDGTPFITAKAKEKGLIVLIHTSANTSWSDFALSGLYVSILKRIIRLAGINSNNIINKNSSYKSLNPLLIIDGYGALVTPPASVKPIATDNIHMITPSSIHPAGLYGQGKIQYALNVGTHITELKDALSKLPANIKHSYYKDNNKYELSLMPYLLYVAALLILLDWIIMIFISGKGIRINSIISFIIAIYAITIALYPKSAIASKEQDIKFASELHLAYIETGNKELDNNTRLALENLSEVLTKRTSVEPAGVVSINPENDEMAFFPLIYWAISENQKTYSSKAMENIQYYLDHGGTILFDTRDKNRSTNNLTRNTPNTRILRSITASLNIPPIIPIPDDHVLGRSFYLLKEYVGHYSSGTLWIEKNSASGRDNVSSVIIGSNDWISAWSSYNVNIYPSRKQEIAMRFGINLIMYTLTGNYKADQVHIPHILKRLGE